MEANWEDFLGRFILRYPGLKALALERAWQELKVGCALSARSILERFAYLCSGEAASVGSVTFGPESLKIMCLVGVPSSHSLSPFLHNRFNESLGAECGLYLTSGIANAADLEAVLDEWPDLPLLGLNVTHPFKEIAFRYLLEHGQLTEAARAIGAVNTVYWHNGSLFGDNTDWRGWLLSWQLKIGEPLGGRQAVIFGAGGAARAVVYALLNSGIRGIIVVNSPARAAALLEHFKSWQGTPEALKLGAQSVPVTTVVSWPHPPQEGCIYIQATPCGQVPNIKLTPYAWPKNTVACRFVACDLVYNPPCTEFLRLAAACGAYKLADGLAMLVAQAYIARQRFLGLDEKDELGKIDILIAQLEQNFLACL